jgi:hypothetical protein
MLTRLWSIAKQYNEFGRDVEAFAESLEILVEVIQKADQKLHHFALSPNAELRWDWRSLRQIIGDCEQTLEDCDDLLIRNSKYASGSGPLRNIEWNLLLQADVDSLQRRIQQHTSKLRLALTPFEMLVSLLDQFHKPSIVLLTATGTSSRESGRMLGICTSIS